MSNFFQIAQEGDRKGNIRKVRIAPSTGLKYHEDMKRQNRWIQKHIFNRRKCRSSVAVFTAALLLCGCSPLVQPDENVKIVFTTGFGDDEVFRIEDSSCDLQEMMVYLVNAEATYVEMLGNQILEADVGDSSVAELLKESTLSRLAQIKTMNLLADEKEIYLTEEELQLAQKAAQTYSDSLSQEMLEAMGNVTVEDLTAMYEDYARADKLYQYTIRDINPEISDDEARTLTVEQIFVSKETTDASSIVQEIRKELTTGTAFETLTEKYNEAEDATISFGKGEVDPALEEAAFNLATNEVSSVIVTEEGFYFLKCLTTFNRSETEANKVRIVEQRKKEAFGEQYDDFAANLTPELNDSLWNTIGIPENLAPMETSFFEVYEDTFPE